MLSHLRGVLKIAVKHVSLYQSGSADLQPFTAAFSHHAPYMFNMILEILGSFFSGNKIIQIWTGSFHPLIKGGKVYKFLQLKTW